MPWIGVEVVSGAIRQVSQGDNHPLGCWLVPVSVGCAVKATADKEWQERDTPSGTKGARKLALDAIKLTNERAYQITGTRGSGLIDMLSIEKDAVNHPDRTLYKLNFLVPIFVDLRKV